LTIVYKTDKLLVGEFDEKLMRKWGNLEEKCEKLRIFGGEIGKIEKISPKNSQKLHGEVVVRRSLS